jgi:5S rRNA maturation endonuclease (ribonuclease M5)
MTKCPNYTKCPFLKRYEQSLEKSVSLKTKIMAYCDGDSQGDCVRKKIAAKLGGPEHVPVNMMPDGKAVVGTGMTDWTPEVQNLVGTFK